MLKSRSMSFTKKPFKTETTLPPGSAINKAWKCHCNQLASVMLFYVKGITVINEPVGSFPSNLIYNVEKIPVAVQMQTRYFANTDMVPACNSCMKNYNGYDFKVDLTDEVRKELESKTYITSSGSRPIEFDK